MPIPFWAGHYIGLPFRDHGRDRGGLDCWGLVRLALAEQFARAVPSLAQEYQRTTQVEKISALIEREAVQWTPVARPRRCVPPFSTRLSRFPLPSRPRIE